MTQARRGNVEQAVESAPDKAQEARHGHTSQSGAHIVSGTNASIIAAKPQDELYRNQKFLRILDGSAAR